MLATHDHLIDTSAMKSQFVISSYPPFRVSKDELLALCRKIVSMWPDPIMCKTKDFGIGDGYGCREIASFANEVMRSFDAETLSDFEDELGGIVVDFVARALKYLSRYMSHISPLDLDLEAIVSDIAARDDVQIEP